MTEKSLQALKKELLSRISKGMGEILLELRELLPTESERISELIQLESRLKEANKDKIKGIISQAALQLRYNQIRDDLIELIQSLSVTDFSRAEAGHKKGRQGSLLYNIPDRMQVAEEAKCVIRLAYEEDVIIENIELQPSVVLKTVRIAAVMQAELLDPAGEPAFAIRSLSSEEQFLEEGAYTEWIFYVTPLKEGTYPLLIKISVVELVQGRERVREIVWEEKVEIVTEDISVAPLAEGFKPSNYRLQFGEIGAPSPPAMEDTLGTLDQPIKDRSDKSLIQQQKKVEPGLKDNRQRRATAKRKNYLQPLLGLLVVVSVAFFLLPPFEKLSPGDHKSPHDSPDSLQDSLQVYPTDSIAVPGGESQDQ